MLEKSESHGGGMCAMEVANTSSLFKNQHTYSCMRCEIYRARMHTPVFIRIETFFSKLFFLFLL